MLTTQAKKILNDVTIEDFVIKWIQGISVTISDRLTLFHSKRYKEEIDSVDVLVTSFVQGRDELDVTRRVLSDVIKPEFVTLRDILVEAYGEQSNEIKLYDHFLFLESNLSNFSEMNKWKYDFYSVNDLMAVIADWEERYRYC